MEALGTHRSSKEDTGVEHLGPTANLLQHRLHWQRAHPALQPRGSLAARSTALNINHPNLRALSELVQPWGGMQEGRRAHSLRPG